MKRALFIILFAVFSFCGFPEAHAQLNLTEAEYQTQLTELAERLEVDYGLSSSARVRFEERMTAYYTACEALQQEMQQYATNNPMLEPAEVEYVTNTRKRELVDGLEADAATFMTREQFYWVTVSDLIAIVKF